MKKHKPRWWFLGIVFGYTLLIRLLPYLAHQLGMQLDPNVSSYPWNFSPMFAVCLFTGAMISNRRTAIMLPLATMLLSDLGIWLITGRLDWAFYPTQFSVYFSLAACVVLGFALSGRRTALTIAMGGLAGCTFFFIVTNFVQWVMLDTYPKNFAGLITCYVAAIPFYRNSLLATGLFSVVLFSPLGAVELDTPPTQKSQQQPTSQ